jgi:hypothetical protein
MVGKALRHGAGDAFIFAGRSFREVSALVAVCLSDLFDFHFYWIIASAN